MIKAIRRNEELIEDILSCSKDENNFYLWWLGQSGYLLQYKRKRILIDPYLSDSLTKKYEKTDKPHKRISELVIEAELLPAIDLITSSHNHTDHLDAETLKPVLNKNPNCKIIIPEANREFVCERLSINLTYPIGINDGETIEQFDFSVTAVPAAHNSIERDEHGRCKFLGYIIQCGTWSIYHSGDTLYYDGMVDIIAKHKPDILILPINGNDPNRKVAGNLDSHEAISLAKLIGRGLVIPCHYDLFEFNTVDINIFIETAIKAKQEYCILDLGGKFSSNDF